MTEEEFRQFLDEHHRTPGTVQSILQDCSASFLVKRAKELQNADISLEEAEQIAKLKRRKLVEDITVLEAGGAIWNEHKQKYMFRSEFSPD